MKRGQRAAKTAIGRLVLPNPIFILCVLRALCVRLFSDECGGSAFQNDLMNASRKGRKERKGTELKFDCLLGNSLTAAQVERASWRDLRSCWENCDSVVMASSRAAAPRLSRAAGVDLVVVRVSGPRAAAGLARTRARRLLALAPLGSSPTRNA